VIRPPIIFMSAFYSLKLNKSPGISALNFPHTPQTTLPLGGRIVTSSSRSNRDLAWKRGKLKILIEIGLMARSESMSTFGAAHAPSRRCKSLRSFRPFFVSASCSGLREPYVAYSKLSVNAVSSTQRHHTLAESSPPVTGSYNPTDGGGISHFESPASTYRDG
jgi:hypothetical protein